MTVYQKLDLLSQAAKTDPVLREKFLATRNAPDPMDAFCRLTEEPGYPISVGELFAAGQEYSDNQCKSTNGGNPSPYSSFEDEYEIFLSSL